MSTVPPVTRAAARRLALDLPPASPPVPDQPPPDYQEALQGFLNPWDLPLPPSPDPILPWDLPLPPTPDLPAIDGPDSVHSSPGLPPPVLAPAPAAPQHVLFQQALHAAFAPPPVAPPPFPQWRYIDSDSSDDDNAAPLPPVNMSPSAEATVVQPKPSAIPILTHGRITPNVIRDLEEGCRAFCLHKNVPLPQQVAVVAWCVKAHPVAKDWYKAEQPTHDAGSLTDWFEAMRKRFLDSDWKETCQRKVWNARQNGRPFLDYVNEVYTLNAVLEGTNRYLDNHDLRNVINGGMDEKLAILAQKERYNLEQNFRIWKEALAILDDRRKESLKEVRDEVRDAVVKLEQTSRSRRDRDYHTSAGKHSTSSSTNTPRAAIPPLTDAERALLRKHKGCFKCRQLGVSHMRDTCRNGFPTVHIPVNDDLVRKYLAKVRVKKEPVAAVTAAPVAGPSATIAAVMPEVDSDGEYPYPISAGESDEYVPPLLAPHFYWDCLVDGPNVPAPLRVSALIDNGSPIVLISADLVAQLGLRKHRLAQKLQVSLALDSSSSSPDSAASSPSSSFLSEWVKLRPKSINSSWSSRPIRAIIATKPCSQIILGQPFLSSNRIIIDHEHRTCIAKETLFDLLRPIESPSPAPKPAPKKRPSHPRGTIKDIRNARALISAMTFNIPVPKATLPVQSPLVSGPPRPECLLAAVRERIERVAETEQLNLLDSKLKSKFSSCFPDDIPHVRSLPDD